MIKKLLIAFKRWIYNLTEYNHLKKILKSVEHRNLYDKVIVFNTVRNFRRHFDHEVFFGLLLALNGAKVKILLDDGVLMHWDTAQIHHVPNIRKIDHYHFNPYHTFNAYENYFSSIKDTFRFFFRRSLRRHALKSYRNKNLEFIFYSDIIDQYHLNYNNWREYEDHIKASTIRFFKTVDLDYSSKSVKYYYKLSIKNAIFSRMVGEYVYNKIKPNLYITSTGLYSTYGPAFDFLIKNNIKCKLSKTGFFGHSSKPEVVYFADTIMEKLSSGDYWNQYKNKPVSQEMRDKVNKYFMKRFKGHTFNLARFNYMQEGEFFRVDKNDGYKYHIVMLPHVIWDGNVKARHTAFNGYLEWMVSTVNYVKDRKDILLYIKAHPAELKRKLTDKSGRVLNLIKKQVDLDNISNIITIPPKQKIETYKFFQSGIDLGLTYDGFLSIEMIYLKIPVITCVKGGRFSVDNGNYTINDKTEYFNYLDNIDSLLEEFHNNYEKRLENIIRYLYWYLYENTVRLPIIIRKGKGTAYYDLKHLTKDDFKIDKNFLEFINR